MEKDLFSAMDNSLPADAPLAARLAPKKLDDFAGQEHLLGPGKLLRRLVEADKVTSAVFYGTPGCGKTALARIIADRTHAFTEELNAAVAGTPELKRLLESARLRKRQGTRTLLILDEIHHFNRTQQDVLLPSVERGEIILIGLTTENPFYYVNSALISRFTLFEFKPLSDAAARQITARALSDEEAGLGKYRAALDDEARDHLITQSSGDARKLLNAVELAVLTTVPAEDETRRITLAIAEESIQKRSIRYDKTSDSHYDMISAFIKSMRGSDPDAAVYWMAKMLAGGEDPRFLARRMFICAAEDVGTADPLAILLAQAAFQASETLGMPEVRIPLAQAAIYIACAPKSNAVYKAIDAAMSEVEKGPVREVPPNLRSGGKNEGYKYPHDYPGHYLKQLYMPKPMEFYKPTSQGREENISLRLKKLREGK